MVPAGRRAMPDVMLTRTGEERNVGLDQYSLEQLSDLLAFRQEVMNQMLLVSTLMAVMALTGAGVILAGSQRGPFRATLLVGFVASTLLFTFSTILDAIIQPAMRRNVAHPNADQIRALIRLGSAVVWTNLIGAVVLIAGLGLLGWLYSRRAGLWTTVLAAATLGMLVACAWWLDVAMRR